MAAGISTRNRATMEKSSLLLKLKARATQLVTIFERLDWKTPCLMHALEKPITVITQRYLSVLRFCRWSKLGHHQKWALLVSEIRVERSHSIFCTNRHKNRHNYCTSTLKSVGAKYIHTRKNNGIYYASQTPDIQLRLLVQHIGTTIADVMYVFMYKARMFSHY